MEQNEGQQMIIKVVFDNDKNKYLIDADKGVSVAEIIFAMSVVIKCLVRDNIVKTTEELETMLHKYLTDSQFNEIKGDD